MYPHATSKADAHRWTLTRCHGRHSNWFTPTMSGDPKIPVCPYPIQKWESTLHDICQAPICSISHAFLFWKLLLGYRMPEMCTRKRENQETKGLSYKISPGGVVFLKPTCRQVTACCCRIQPFHKETEPVLCNQVVSLIYVTQLELFIPDLMCFLKREEVTESMPIQV